MALYKGSFQVMQRVNYCIAVFYFDEYRTKFDISVKYLGSEWPCRLTTVKKKDFKSIQSIVDYLILSL